MWLSELLYNKKVTPSKNAAKKLCSSGKIELDQKIIHKDKKLKNSNVSIKMKLGEGIKITSKNV